MVDHIVLAYSGGLDTSVAVHWLAAHHQADVTAVLVDLGQETTALKAAQERALANGAKDCIVAPARTAFASDFLAPAIQANALYEGAYPLGTALSRPLIAAKLVEAAQQVGADAIAHGCTGKGNDQVRIEAGIAALAPDLTVLAPQRTHPMTRDEALAYAKEHALALPTLSTSAYSTDENLWTRSVEGGDLEDPALPVPEDAFEWTTAPSAAPETPATIELTFQAGVPVALGGQPLALADLCDALNPLAGAHGIGRIDHVENRLVGIKSREVYEAPAAVTLLAAKRALETLVLTREVDHAKPAMEAQFAQLTYDGLWYSPLMSAVQAFLANVQQPVTGTVTLEAYKGSLTVVGRTAEQSLYAPDLATYGVEDAFDHLAASGFIDLWTLPLATLAKVKQAAKEADLQGAQPTLEASQ